MNVTWLNFHSWLFKSVAKELNSGLQRTMQACGQTAMSVCQIWHPNQSAMQPPSPPITLCGDNVILKKIFDLHFQVGLCTTCAILLHEIPHEVCKILFLSHTLYMYSSSEFWSKAGNSGEVLQFILVLLFSISSSTHVSEKAACKLNLFSKA